MLEVRFVKRGPNGGTGRSMHIILEYTVYVLLVLTVATLLFASCVALIMIHAGAMHLRRIVRTVRLPLLFGRRNPETLKMREAPWSAAARRRLLIAPADVFWEKNS